MRLGLDIYGVITEDPKLFSELTALLKLHNHEIHILTGVEDGDRVRKELAFHGISYTDFFSITSYHKELGTPMKFKNGDPTQPVIDDELWDITKAQYCCNKNIDIHIDDSMIYGKYFHAIKTQYIIYYPAIKEFLSLLLRRNI